MGTFDGREGIQISAAEGGTETLSRGAGREAFQNFTREEGQTPQCRFEV